jgi:hypothetical protein
MKKKIILFSITILLVGLPACVPDPPNMGFRVHTNRTTIVSGSPIPSTVNAPHIGVNGNFESFINNATPTRGSVAGFSGFTNDSAYLDIQNAKLPGNWRFGETSGPCAGQSVVLQVPGPGHTATLDCRDIPITFFSFSPSTIERDIPPDSITIDGAYDISTQDGMPTVEYYDLNGVFITQTTASQVAPDGTALTAPTPDISLFSSGAYIALVRNADGNSPGNGVMVIFDYVEPPPTDPPPDPGSCGGDQVCPVY